MTTWDDAMDSTEELPAVEMVAEEVGGMVPQGTSMLQTRGQYSTAMKVTVPRDLKVVQARLMEEAVLLGEDAYYAWGSGKNHLEGPSQALAHSAARCWGNCAVEPGLIQDLPGEWIITMYFIDHETGFTLGRPFKQSKKSIVYGKHDAERKADIRFAIGTSKSTRNVLLKALPKSLIDRAIRAAKKGVREKVQAYVDANGIYAAYEICLRALEKHGVDEDMILAKLAIESADAIDVDRIMTLRSYMSSLDQGEAGAHTIFGGGNGEKDREPQGPIDPDAIPEAPKNPDAKPSETEAKKVDETDNPETSNGVKTFSASKVASLKRQALKVAGMESDVFLEAVRKHFGHPLAELDAAAETEILRLIERAKR